MIATACRQKTSAGKGLGKEVRSLLRCGHVDQLYFLSGYLVADLVVPDVDVLGGLMMHWIHGKLYI